jgi:hypothetical protein
MAFLFVFFPQNGKNQKKIKKIKKNLTSPNGGTIMSMMHDASNIKKCGEKNGKKVPSRAVPNQIS